ncbi:MAG: AraC family transcriptional regulator [Ignavibacteriales bacterium]|nr:AraC family transcriptional regulator [Ignavibacteriales bacterium]
MDMTFANIVLIVAAAQSFLLSTLIYQKHRALFPNRFLALLMLSYTIILLHLLFQDNGVYRIFPIIYLVVGVPLVVAQLQYLYTKYLLNRTERFVRRDLLHFLPFGIFETGMIIAFFSGSVDFSDAAISDPTTTPRFFRIFNWLLIAQGSIYMGVSYRLIVRYNRHLKDVVSSVEQVQMTWLRNITLAGISAWILFFIEDLLLTQGINLSNFVFVSVVFAVYVYAMGFVGLLKSEIFASPDVERTMHEISEIDHAGEPSATKYEKSGLTEETAQSIVTRLLELMEKEKLYTHPSLTLSQLSEKLSVSSHNLSEVINSQLKKNFYDFVNGYRIEQVKKDLVDPSKQHIKILSLAFDTGFNSKATFNTLFKEVTGRTPSEYRAAGMQSLRAH